MRKVMVHLSLSLDGVMQAPGRPQEDPRNGFAHGGWAASYFDRVMAEEAGAGMAEAPALLFGRRTYEDFYAVWPNRKDNPFTEVLNASEKIVVSRSQKEPLPWKNSTLLLGEAVTTVAQLKQTPGKDLLILGSGQLIRALMQASLIDHYALLIHPLVLGSGQRLFADEGALQKLKLIDCKSSTTGVLLTSYQPA